MIKPVFVPKKARETLAERERVEPELDAGVGARPRHEGRNARRSPARWRNSKCNARRSRPRRRTRRHPTDTDDDVDPEGVRGGRLRELARIEEERERREHAERELEEQERLRAMSEEEKAEWLAANPREETEKEKTKMGFMQKAITRERSSRRRRTIGSARRGPQEIYKRDFSEGDGRGPGRGQVQPAEGDAGARGQVRKDGTDQVDAPRGGGHESARGGSVRRIRSIGEDNREAAVLRETETLEMITKAASDGSSGSRRRARDQARARARRVGRDVARKRQSVKAEGWRVGGGSPRGKVSPRRPAARGIGSGAFAKARARGGSPWGRTRGWCAAYFPLERLRTSPSTCAGTARRGRDRVERGEPRFGEAYLPPRPSQLGRPRLADALWDDAGDSARRSSPGTGAGCTCSVAAGLLRRSGAGTRAIRPARTLRRALRRLRANAQRRHHSAAVLEDFHRELEGGATRTCMRRARGRLRVRRRRAGGSCGSTRRRVIVRTRSVAVTKLREGRSVRLRRRHERLERRGGARRRRGHRAQRWRGAVCGTPRCGTLPRRRLPRPGGTAARCGTCSWTWTAPSPNPALRVEGDGAGAPSARRLFVPA